MPLEEAAAPLVALVREFRPHVVTTYDENGGYPHPDHVRCHEVTVEAFEAAADPERYPGTGAPWQPLKLYYHQTFHKRRVEALHDTAVDAGLDSPYAEWLADWKDDPEHAKRLTTFVDVADWFPVRDEALKAHASQVDPDGPLVPAAHRAAEGCVAHRGLRARQVAGGDRASPRTTCSPACAPWCGLRDATRSSSSRLD